MRNLAALLASILLLLFSVVPAFAQQPNSIPERNGDYPDPEHPGIRVRVFVHEANSARSTSPSLVCSNDPGSTSVVPPAGWHLPSGNWIYNLNTSSAPAGIGSSNFTTLSANAFGAWNSAVATSSSHPTLTKGADTTFNRQAYDGQNIVAWGRTSGTALAVTYTRYNSSTGTTVDVDTIFNQKFPWNWNGGISLCADSATYDAQDILTHETGHWMGLNDTYDASFINNTMYGYGAKGEVKKDTLTSGDINGVKAIYQ